MYDIHRIYTPPFTHTYGAIYDLYENKVVDIRGWGRIQYMEDPEELQDAIGERIASILTENWTPLPEPEKVQQEALTELREAVWIAEQHTDSAVGRRLQDYKKTISHVVRAIELLASPQTEDRE